MVNYKIGLLGTGGAIPQQDTGYAHLTGNTVLSRKSARNHMEGMGRDHEHSETKYQGSSSERSRPQFEKAALDIWNKYGPPKRRPQLIFRVANEQDVVEAVRFARSENLKIAVRGGGHLWCNPTLRRGGMMIDLTNLNQVISIDAKAHKAVVQPIISNREIQARLNAQNLSYPSGHARPSS